ncbi:phosphoribosylglycinamide formyltransferase [Marinobacterium nitratireducens]|uniref:Phosphoribosylglycinamide formyltransferase n=1 Tax=Marinobacterium nitratireducens TaxID=518897 RepID=A0A917ZQ44_9GAMM|nr:phosphoribosylglycinamide formyltransferase [Marinobacterium nitratireducens]GGO87585.1 phosphoribosylglycinamide formyltransferase [Marinobacterium nitratireducens]
MAAKRIVVLISGSGSNLQALIDSTLSGRIDGRIVSVISNRPDAFGLERARRAGIRAEPLDHKAFDSRETFDAALQELIDSHEPDLVVLAGFMRILTPEFVSHYLGRMFNIHPSLLPKYKGLNTHQRALDAGDTEHGCTVHFVTPELDGGPLVVQAAVPVEAGDDADSLQQRVHRREHEIYPLAVEWFCADRLRLLPEGVEFDGQHLPQTGLRLEP